MRLSYAGCCQRGFVRSANEDASLMRAAGPAALFLVADGIGGREHGAQASGLLRDGCSRWWQERQPSLEGMSLMDAAGELREVLLEQNREIIRRYGARRTGSTLALLFLLRDRYVYLSAGDSRIYRVRGWTLRQLTVDDVCGNFTGAPGMPEEPDAAARGKLMGAVGLEPVPPFTVGTGELHRGDRFFLCSDGVHGCIAPRRLGRSIRLGGGNPSRLVAGLAREVERNGARDNYSMICVLVDEA